MNASAGNSNPDLIFLAMMKSISTILLVFAVMMGAYAHISAQTIPSEWSSWKPYADEKDATQGKGGSASQRATHRNSLLTVVADTILARFTSVDPHWESYRAWNPYQYGANSPLLNTDPDGMDIIVLYNKNSVGGLGHMAVLIGDDKNGWTYYSKNGGASGSSGTSDKTQQQFTSLEQFTTSDMAQGYTSAFQIPASPMQDAAMRNAAKQQINEDYDVLSNSCGHTAVVALQAGGFPRHGQSLGPGGRLDGPLPSDPLHMFINIKVGNAPLGGHSISLAPPNHPMPRY